MTISICVRTTLEGMLLDGALAFAGLCGMLTSGINELCHMRSWLTSSHSLGSFTKQSPHTCNKTLTATITTALPTNMMV